MSRGPWKLSFLGTGSMSVPYRCLPAVHLQLRSSGLLFDCGDGTLNQLRRQKFGLGPGVVLLTSLGTAEVSGLLALAQVMVQSRLAPLRLVGPPGTEQLAATLTAISSYSAGPLFDVVEGRPGEVVCTTAAGEYVEVVPIERSKGGPGAAYLVYEDPTPGRVDAEKAQRLGIGGEEIAQLVAGKTVRRVRPSDVIGPTEPGKRILFVGRGRTTPELSAELTGANAAVFAAPFMDDRLELAHDASCLTGWEAAELASDAGVDTVVLTQAGPYAPLRVFTAEARQFHRRLFGAQDGDELTVFPERGQTKFNGRNARPGGSR